MPAGFPHPPHHPPACVPTGIRVAARAASRPRFPVRANIDSAQCPEPKFAIQKVFDGFKNSHWRRQMRAESPMKTDEILMTAAAANPAVGPTRHAGRIAAPFVTTAASARG
ncbi:hypothetical protein [Burkholderia pseudomultivorans]|nr:hypothetical protein [Burkholderia pseudomultivorans]